MNKKLKYKFLANVVMITHLMLITFIILSIPIVIIFPKSNIIVLLICFLILFIGFISGGCPATDLEKKLLQKHDPKQVYKGRFIEHKLEKFFKIKATNNQVKKAGYVFLVALVLCAVRAYLLNQ